MEHEGAESSVPAGQVAATTIAGFPGIMAKGVGTTRPEPVVCLHGAFGDHAFFAPWLPVFAAAGFDTYALSRRGRNGVSPEPPTGVQMDDYLDDTERVLNAVGGTPVVVGHSLGGLLAQRLAAAGRCRAAVLVAPAPPGVLTPHPRALPYLLPQLPAILLGRPFLIGTRGARRVVLNHVPARRRDGIYDAFVPESGVTFREMMFGRIRVDPASVTCPVLVVGGEDDRVISSRLMRRTGRHFSAETRVHDGHGHWIPDEPGGEAVAADIVRWIEIHA